MCQTEHLGSAEPFLDGRAGAPLWPPGQGASSNQDVKPHGEIQQAEPSSTQAVFALIFLVLPGGWMELCFISGFKLHQPCTQHGLTRALQASNS